MSTKHGATPIPLSVAEFLTLGIEASGKSQAQIAQEAGFNKPNIITMLKQGKTNLPQGKIGPLARALGVDAIQLWQLAMREYTPETAEAVDAMYKQPVLTENELAVIKALRAAGGLPIRKLGDSEIAPIARAIKGAIPIA